MVSPKYVINPKEGGEKKAGERTNPFRWMIDGFSTIANRGADTYYSGSFTACGFNWKLRLESVLEDDGEEYVSLYLSHDDAASKSSVIKAIYKLFIYDQLHGEHILKEGEDYFHSTSNDGFCCKVALNKFNSSKSGLLVNDCCIFGAEVLEAFACKLDKEGLIHESLSLKKDLTPRIYTWVIKDVSKSKDRLLSEAFVAGGYNWKLRLDSVLEADGEKYVGLYLSHDDAVSKNSVIKAIYKLFVYDQLHAEHIQKEGEDYFHSTSHDGFCCMIALNKFNSSKTGLLVNDCCIFGAEVLEAFACKLDKEGSIHESLSLKKDLTPRIYTWVIKDVSKLKNLIFAEVFAAGGYNWRICLYPNLPSFEDFLSVFLIMTNAASLASKTRVYVDFSFCLLDQHNAKHWKLTVKHLFSSENRFYGCRNFLSQNVVRDPSRGFLLNDTCIIEASVVVLGVDTIA